MSALLEMNTSPAEPEPALQVKSPMRFTYASGSRPLDGYTIKRGVGRGGFGEVYFAVSDAGKEVALKLIRRNLEVELRGVTHCLNLKHPNLVALYDIRTDEHEDRWVVMEYVSGESLEDLIDRYPQGMPKEVAIRWFDGICSAVAYLHDHGIVHRDLKPANIFIDDGTIKIGDYGLSKFISCSRRSGQTESVGTVHYMAPEIANGRYGREIDAYALGIILYEMLTGRVPFEGESVGEVLMKHLTAEPSLDAIEEPFRSVVRGAMAKDPERRINSASQMMDLLRGVVRPAAMTEPHPGLASGTSFPPNNSSAQTFNGPPKPQQTAASFAPAFHRFNPDAFFHRDPEPVWAAIKRGWFAVRKDLNYDHWTVTGRIAFAVFSFLTFIFFFYIWIPILLVMAVAYAGYRLMRIFVRAVTVAPSTLAPSAPLAPLAAAGSMAAAAAVSSADPAGQPTSATAVTTPPHQPGTRAPWRRRGQAGWRQAAQQELLARPVRDRASSIIGSMLAAGVVGPVAALLACMFLVPDNLPVELTVWTAIVATLASWALMVPGQLAEARMEDHAPLRFMQLLLGALVGIIAWAAANAMFLKLPASRDFSPGPHDSVGAAMFNQRFDLVQQGYQAGQVQMPLAMFAAYFACFFVLLRWWRLTESTRPTRVSLWATAWCAFIGWAMTFFWWFPQPMGLMLAAVIAFTVQLSSPWLSPSRRRELAQQAA